MKVKLLKEILSQANDEADVCFYVPEEEMGYMCSAYFSLDAVEYFEEDEICFKKIDLQE